MVVKRVGPLSCAKVAGTLYAILGLFFGGFISIATVATRAVGGFSDGGPFQGLFGIAAVVLLPLLYGCIGFVMTLIMAGLYNLIASGVGGIEVDLQ